MRDTGLDMGKQQPAEPGRVTATRVLEFDAGHRLLGHESKCRNVHGHRYRLELSVAAPRLDTVGRVIDFSVVKRLVGGWIDEHWDHGYLARIEDPVLHTAADAGLKVWVMAVEPTAENMVSILVAQAQELLEPHDIEVVRARLWETPNCYVDWEGP